MSRRLGTAMSSARRGGLLRVDAAQPIVVRIAGRVTPADVPRLCAELSAQLMGADAAHATGAVPATGDIAATDATDATDATGAVPAPRATEAICDVGELTHPNLAAVDALARLQLTARRLGCRIRLRNAGHELLSLLDLVGLVGLFGAGLGPAPPP
ncbi:MAG TPA: STAS domain-containing protein [Streptomyces sp.]|nr:STAS domain-containing protein [Streptomyces sp.]